MCNMYIGEAWLSYMVCDECMYINEAWLSYMVCNECMYIGEAWTSYMICGELKACDVNDFRGVIDSILFIRPYVNIQALEL